MAIITIQKKEYEKLKQQASLYEKMASEIAHAEEKYPYDVRYVAALTKQALRDHKKEKSIQALSINDALQKFRKK